MKWINGQAFAHYTELECAQVGYWSGGGCTHNTASASCRVLRGEFSGAIKSLFLMWPTSCAIHLTNKLINRKAWLGQAACFIECGNCRNCTIESWFAMSILEQQIANEVALHWIASWNKVNSKNGNFQQLSIQLDLVF